MKKQKQELNFAKEIKKGDRVIIYLPMIPEAAFAMLACARVGAIHSVVFAGFSSFGSNPRGGYKNIVRTLLADIIFDMSNSDFGFV